MLAIFCLRLAWGLAASLFVLSVKEVPPRFFRVQYLTALGLLAVAAFFEREEAALSTWVILGVAMTLSFLGSIIWHLDNHPGQRIILVLANLALAAGLLFGPKLGARSDGSSWILADDLTSVAVLGTATSAMLMGHSYLIAPAMSLRPLYRLLASLAAALVGRAILACLGLYLWTGRSGAGNLETEMVLWLGVRWLVGLLGPLVLTWLAWETARIRSTQSATGILYVVVILVFLGELTSQLLFEKTRLVL